MGTGTFSVEPGSRALREGGEQEFLHHITRPATADKNLGMGQTSGPQPFQFKERRMLVNIFVMLSFNMSVL